MIFDDLAKLPSYEILWLEFEKRYFLNGIVRVAPSHYAYSSIFVKSGGVALGARKYSKLFRCFVLNKREWMKGLKEVWMFSPKRWNFFIPAFMCKNSNVENM